MTRMVCLGDKVIDPLTGFCGIVTSRTEYLFGCVRVAVEPGETKDGKPMQQDPGGPGDVPPVRSMPPDRRPA
jgi:hypothetical protein